MAEDHKEGSLDRRLLTRLGISQRRDRIEGNLRCINRTVPAADGHNIARTREEVVKSIFDRDGVDREFKTHKVL